MRLLINICNLLPEFCRTGAPVYYYLTGSVQSLPIAYIAEVGLIYRRTADENESTNAILFLPLLPRHSITFTDPLFNPVNTRP